ncbi:MAG: hypothetical protein OSB57_01745 [Planctomycetota bacterium]|nr:hypothetical protein [Planctomycetota bacterium]
MGVRGGVCDGLSSWQEAGAVVRGEAPRVPALRAGTGSRTMGDKDPRARRNAQADRAANQSYQEPLHIDAKGRVALRQADSVVVPAPASAESASIPADLGQSPLSSSATYDGIEASLKGEAINTLEAKVDAILAYMRATDFNKRTVEQNTALRALVVSITDAGMMGK